MLRKDSEKLNIYDIPYDYDYDVINCFEHPIAAILNYFDHTYTDYYIALAKFRGVYTQGNVRKLVLNETKELFGIEILETLKLNYKMMAETIDNNQPLLIAVNLKEIFYSEHYKKKNWGHWLLVKGYNRVGELVTIFDNTQFEYSGHEYGTFHLPYELLKRANDDYKKVLGKEYACSIFRKEKEVKPITVLRYILKKYTEIDLSVAANYKQIEILKALGNLINEENIDINYYGNELKKKLIHVNKYRKLFQTEMEKFMHDYEFESERIEEYRSYCIELNNLWEIFIMKKVVESVRGRLQNPEPEERIIRKERQIQKIIIKFQNYINTEIREDGISRKTMPYPLENNEDNIITGNAEEIEFYFPGRKTYNWWDMDEAPKVLLQSELENRNFEIRTVLTLDEGYNAKNQEAGIFIRNRKSGQSLIIGIENEENFVLDETEVTGHRFFVGKQQAYPLFLRNKEGILECGLYISGMEQVIFQYEYGSVEDSEIGLVCKTWGKGGILRIKFQEILYSGR